VQKDRYALLVVLARNDDDAKRWFQFCKVWKLELSTLLLEGCSNVVYLPGTALEDRPVINIGMCLPLRTKNDFGFWLPNCASHNAVLTVDLSTLASVVTTLATMGKDRADSNSGADTTSDDVPNGETSSSENPAGLDQAAKAFDALAKALQPQLDQV